MSTRNKMSTVMLENRGVTAVTPTRTGPSPDCHQHAPDRHRTATGPSPDWAKPSPDPDYWNWLELACFLINFYRQNPNWLLSLFNFYRQIASTDGNKRHRTVTVPSPNVTGPSPDRHQTSPWCHRGDTAFF